MSEAKCVVTIDIEEYNSLKRGEAILIGLDAYGVDNWHGYSDGYQYAKDNNPELFNEED